jgi:hypothetical protein
MLVLPECENTLAEIFGYGHPHCLQACSCGKLPNVPVLMDPDKNNRGTDK